MHVKPRKEKVGGFEQSRAVELHGAGDAACYCTRRCCWLLHESLRGELHGLPGCFVGHYGPAAHPGVFLLLCCASGRGGLWEAFQAPSGGLKTPDSRGPSCGAH